MTSPHAFPIELRICGTYGPKGGYFRLQIHSEEEAILAAVQLRGLGMGLCYRRGQNMVSWNYMAVDSVFKTLAKAGLCQNPTAKR